MNAERMSEPQPAAGSGVQLERPPRLQPRLRILHLEDSEDDHALTVLQLRRAGLQADFTRVEDLSAFEAALTQPWDAVLSDYNLPGFTGLDALAVFRGTGLVLPFILVSGEIGEETAVEAMRSGASDYLLKQNLARL
ncbi:MAG: response regulator, partial [Rubrivivax sp.]